MDMNYQKLCKLAAVFLMTGVPAASAAGIQLRGIATVIGNDVILDVFADTGKIPLRGFGFSAKYDPGELSFVSGGRYAGLWFLRGENGVSYAYTDVSVPDPGLIRVVGGRFDGDHPGEGIAGDNLLLATLVFKRLPGSPPEIELGLAEPESFVSFAAADGESLDEDVEPQKVVVLEGSEDADGDGLPDNYERDTFGDLVTSDGSGDVDGDGDPDRDEWLRGTDPTDPHSSFVLEVIPQGDGTKIALWTGRLDRVYDVEWSRNLESFEPIWVGLPGLEPLMERLDDLHNGDTEGFYRVITRFPTLGR